MTIRIAILAACASTLIFVATTSAFAEGIRANSIPDYYGRANSAESGKAEKKASPNKMRDGTTTSDRMGGGGGKGAAQGRVTGTSADPSDSSGNSQRKSNTGGGALTDGMMILR